MGDPGAPGDGTTVGDGAPSVRLLRISGPQAILNRACSGPYRIEHQTLQGVAAPLTDALAVSLTADIEDAAFFSDETCATGTTLATIASGASSTSVWFRQLAATPVTLTAVALDRISVPLPVVVNEPHWHFVAPPLHPEARLAAAAAFHPGRGTVLLYGGCAFETSVRYADTWEWDGSTWTRLCSACAPGFVGGQVMTYDPEQDRILMFGGTPQCELAPTNVTNALWEWTAAGGWSALSSTGAPSARWAAASAYDVARSRWVIFGGAAAGGAPFDDVWEYSSAGWTGSLQPAPRPSARLLASATYSPMHGEVLLYGGDPTALDDLWSWNGWRWQQRCSACTGQGRASAMLAYYPPQRLSYLVHGYADPSGDVIGVWWLEGDTFHLDAFAPPPRDTSVLVFDPGRARLVLFGGNGAGCSLGDCDDTWELGFP